MAESMFEVANNITGEQRPVRRTDVSTLRS